MQGPDMGRVEVLEESWKAIIYGETIPCSQPPASTESCASSSTLPRVTGSSASGVYAP